MSTAVIDSRCRRAIEAGLVYVDCFDDWIRRLRWGRGFTYRLPGGETLRCTRTRRRIKQLVIPPAWNDVNVCPDPAGHIQALGVDQAGRRQYIYHAHWQSISNLAKFDRMEVVGKSLPRIRRRVRRDLRCDALSEPRILAAVVRLIDKAHLRVGNRSYVDSSGARGATTLASEHASIDQTRVRLEFTGKSGKLREVELADAKVAEVVSNCSEIEGQFLFQYRGEDGQFHQVSSTMVNDYLREISGENITAKDFRTWWGSVIALSELMNAALSSTAVSKRQMVSDAVSATAEALGNTNAVCKSSYIHPGILDLGEHGPLEKLARDLPKKGRREMTVDETRFLATLPHLDSVTPGHPQTTDA